MNEKKHLYPEKSSLVVHVDYAESMSLFVVLYISLKFVSGEANLHLYEIRVARSEFSAVMMKKKKNFNHSFTEWRLNIVAVLLSWLRRFPLVGNQHQLVQSLYQTAHRHEDQSSTTQSSSCA